VQNYPKLQSTKTPLIASLKFDDFFQQRISSLKRLQKVINKTKH